MKEKKIIPIVIVVILVGVSCFSGCVGPWAVDTLGWEHINFLSEYNFEVRNVPLSDKLRPLNVST